MAKSKAKKRKKKGRRQTDFPLIHEHLDDYGTSITIDGEAFGFAKMSDVLCDFVRPLAEDATTEQDWRSILSLGIVAWNATLLLPSEGLSRIDATIEKFLPKEGLTETKYIIHQLMYRKHKYFASIQRLMIDYDVAMTPDGPYVRVVSTAV